MYTRSSIRITMTDKIGVQAETAGEKFLDKREAILSVVCWVVELCNNKFHARSLSTQV